MDTTSVWQLLSKIPTGTAVAWATVIICIITTVSTGIVKLYQTFNKIKSKQDKMESIQNTLIEHDNVLSDLRASLTDIQTSLNEQKEVNLKQLRYSIAHTCDDAIAAGSISCGKLRSLEELFEEYETTFNSNGYIKTLVNKVRNLPVIGKLDE
jgi:hypothetical protein